jgi:hypothetical protein
MSIYKGTRRIGLVQKGSRAIMAIYKGTRLVWSKVASYWRGELVWHSDNTWHN